VAEERRCAAAADMEMKERWAQGIGQEIKKKDRWEM
jgi:hypothetical protein